MDCFRLFSFDSSGILDLFDQHDWEQGLSTANYAGNLSSNHFWDVEEVQGVQECGCLHPDTVENCICVHLNSGQTHNIINNTNVKVKYFHFTFQALHCILYDFLAFLCLLNC